MLGKVELGISQNMLCFAPDRWWHPLDRALVRLGAHAYNHAFHEALVTGKLRVTMPGVASTRVDIPEARGSCEFIGVNYYSRAHLRFTPRPPFIEFKYRDTAGPGPHGHRLGGLPRGLRADSARGEALRAAGVDYRERHR